MPTTRKERLLNTMVTGVASGVEPITREEQYLSYIAGETYTKPDAPITRKEFFLDKIPQGGGNGGGVNKLPKVFDGSITELTAEDLQGATTVRDYALYHSESIKKVVIPDGVTSIGNDAFNNCYNMEYLEIPASVTYIGYNAFNECIGMQTLRVKGSTPPELSASLGDMYKAKIEVDKGCGNAYKSATNWSEYASQIVEEGGGSTGGDGNWLFKDEYIDGSRADLPAPVGGVSYTLFVGGEEIATRTAEYNDVEEVVYLTFRTEDRRVVFIYDVGVGGWHFHSIDSQVTSGTVSVRING
jgi:hypothetical protein